MLFSSSLHRFFNAAFLLVGLAKGNLLVKIELVEY